MHSHNDFITSSITIILNDVVTANALIGAGIETFPLGEYVMQSAFLKMTGFQEQKMKCICWELATRDYTYRYKRFSQNQLGECSTYKEKKIVYQDLIEQINLLKPNFDVSTSLNRDEIKRQMLASIHQIIHNSNLSSWAEHSYLEFENFAGSLRTNQFGNETNLFENILQDRYLQLYSHRNRCAHNTLSYQHNLPTLKVMADENYVHDNYFTRFALLILIDEIFIRLYTEYLGAL